MQIEPNIIAANKFQIVIKDSINGNNTITFNEIIPRGGWLKIQFGSDGSKFHVRINGITQTVLSGTDNGDWIGDLGTAITRVSLGVGWGNQFSAYGLRHIAYMPNRIYTDAELTFINNSPEYQPSYTP